MGNAPSASEQQNSGWRILRIMPNSPCSNCQLVLFFDYVMGADGKLLDGKEETFYHAIKEKKDQPLKLTVYNYKTTKTRGTDFFDITVIPNNNWGGEGLLGLVIRYDSFENADEHAIHVLDVFPNSPASTAGLQPFEDYLLGTSEVILKGYDELDFVLTKSLGKPVQIYVFNARHNTVREVTITPNDKWGGQGRLGCDVGHGLLHRLPMNPRVDVDMSIVDPFKISEAIGRMTETLRGKESDLQTFQQQYARLLQAQQQGQQAAQQADSPAPAATAASKSSGVLA